MLYALAVVLVLILDQWLKYWVTINIALDAGSRELIPGIVSLVNIHNSGAAYGILDSGNWRWVFVAIAVIFTVLAVIALKKGLIKHALGRWAMVGVLAGAIGNCIDRVLFGYVVDMFKLEFMDYAIFNVADMFISCCGILFCLYIIFSGDGKKHSAEEEEEEPSGRERRSGRDKAAGGHSRAARQRPARAERPRREEEPREERAAEPRFERAGGDARVYTPHRPSAERPAPGRRPDAADERQAAPRAAARPSAAAPAADEARQQPPKSAPPTADGEFSLEDILAEFGSK